MLIFLVSSLALSMSVSVLEKVFRMLYYSKFSTQASYLPLISHLRKVLGDAHKKFYTISVGKLNPSKLANFMEIECFVLVACPENSVLETKVRVILSLLMPDYNL